MLLKTLTAITLFITLPIYSMAQSERYTIKKDSALNTISPFEVMANHRQKDVKLAYEDKELMAFEPIRKQAPVHLLIVPKKRIYTLNETQTTDQRLLGKMILVAKDIARKKGIDKTGYRLTINTNEDAGQSVFHIHLHLLGGANLGPMVDQAYKNNLPMKERPPIDQSIQSPTVEKYLQTMLDSVNFQGTVLIAKQDSIIHHSAYGMFDVENKIPNTIHTQYLIGSLTKSFVATAIMQLVEKGLVDLHAPVQQYIPNLKNELANGLTVHHLLKQQSGLPVFIDDLTDVEVMDIMPSEILDIINKSKRSFDPGEKFEYSNINYNLLAMVVEQVSGQHYQAFLQENIFNRTGMSSSGVERLLNVPENRAIGYRMVNNKFRRIQNVVSYAFGTGDIYSTAMDLYKWSNALQAGELVSALSSDKMFSGGTKDWGYYGYGFRIQPYRLMLPFRHQAL